MIFSNLVVVNYFNFESHCCMVADEGVHEKFPPLREPFSVKWQTFIIETIDSQKIVRGQWVCVLRFELSLKGKNDVSSSGLQLHIIQSP